METWPLTPQFWSIVIVTISVTILSLVIFFIFRKKDPKLPPNSNLQIITEHVIEGFDNFATELTGGKLRAAYPYFFTLFIMISMGSIVGLMGFENPATTPWFTLGLAIISFTGIFVVGIVFNGIIGFIKHKYKNPLELFTQFAPLLSLAVRLFGATFAFAVILNLIPQILSSLGFGNLATTWPLISSIWHWVPLSADFSLSIIQAYVFMVLTMMYWRQEIPQHSKKISKKKLEKKILKDALKSEKKNNKINYILNRNFDINKNSNIKKTRNNEEIARQ